MRIDPANTAVLVVDYQEKLLPAIHDVEHLLQRKLPEARLVSVDYDASTGEGTVQSRIRMLLDEEL
jgi:nicotinamidase-related amidase